MRIVRNISRFQPLCSPFFVTIRLDDTDTPLKKLLCVEVDNNEDKGEYFSDPGGLFLKALMIFLIAFILSAPLLSSSSYLSVSLFKSSGHVGMQEGTSIFSHPSVKQEYHYAEVPSCSSKLCCFCLPLIQTMLSSLLCSSTRVSLLPAIPIRLSIQRVT